MHFTLISDIFGRTSALEKLATELSSSSEIIDPYESKNISFDNELEAYNYFTSHIGMDAFTLKVLEKLKEKQEETVLIGFSIGATAIWKTSCSTEISHINSAICFYGSQIRNHKNIIPLFPIQTIFPQSEPHFSVTDLIADLSTIENLKVTQVNFLHGFMNPLSRNYNQVGYQQRLQALKNRFK
ncbi:dienelactone hydrolase family protein [Microbulbifer sp. GL-2]|uniref:dienelactone hydrolase family protein n=1 Tax=Microbulbifer sp. GL-2 TaxID=2591606 RepID=UPI001163C5D4|nr:dienelactone hydrolase family protein [Microbulbifer sp. GL-2]BBM01819.1 dienelactone hydrolase [Microbulbifer sp. GL-2]